MFWLNRAYAEGSTLMPPDASNFANSVDMLYEFLLIASLISCVLVIGGLIYFALKYRRKSENDKTAYISHNAFLEFLWSFIPFLIFLASFGWGWKIFHEMKRAPENAFEIHVEGFKWAWSFNYKSGKNTLGEITVPVNTPIKLIMTSRDVIHNFFIPAFRVKQDVVPGMYSSLWFEATKEGSFQVTCAEFCGDSHSIMRAKVHVVSKDNFDRWLAGDGTSEEEGGDAQPMSMVELGKKVYETKVCITCHSLTEKTLTGPGFKGLFGSTRNFEDGSSAVADENYLRESIVQPQAKVVKGFAGQNMPSLQASMTEKELTAVIEFIKTIK